jgi:CRP-like cAMP-binding protein
MHVVLRKLRNCHTISEEEQGAVLAALTLPRTFQAGTDIVPDASTPQHTTVILSGAACRYKVLRNGKRHVLTFQYPGDMVDLYSYVMKRMDHAVGALTECTVAQIPHSEVAALSMRYPNLQFAFWRDTMIDASIANTWALGESRSTLSRIAHTLCEIYVRLEAVGLAKVGDPLPFAIKQQDLADALGLSLVHTNKMLAVLKRQKLIRLTNFRFEILDWEGLAKIADFDPAYMHFKGV